MNLYSEITKKTPRKDKWPLAQRIHFWVTNGFSAFTFFNFCWILNKTLKTSVDQWILVLKKWYKWNHLSTYIFTCIKSIYPSIHPSTHISTLHLSIYFIIIAQCFGFLQCMSRILNSSNNNTVLCIYYKNLIRLDFFLLLIFIFSTHVYFYYIH